MYVWVVEDNKVHKREVTVNAPTGEAQALISEGLKPGEKIFQMLEKNRLLNRLINVFHL